MTTPSTPQDLAAQAEDALRALTHHTRRPAGDPGDPADLAQLIASLARLTGMLPQLHNQLADTFDHAHRARHLRLDTDTDTEPVLHALTAMLRAAGDDQCRAAATLDAAHQHAARLTLQPAQPQPNRGQNSCRSVGPNHLTKPTWWTPMSGPRSSR
ncbi:MAG: hypothetical protein WCA29_02320 [Jiangellales bacterium]